MKHLKLIFAAAIIVASAFTAVSCKKGKNDPFLSLRSRDGRIDGIWKLTGINGTSTTITVNGSNRSESTTTTKYSEGTQTVTTTGGGSGTQTKYEFVVTIGKDGAWKSVQKNFNSAGTQTGMFEGDGSWTWASDGKKKSSININDPQNTFLNGVAEVDQLKNKEMIIKVESRTKQTFTNNSTEIIKSMAYTFTAQ